MDDEQPFARMTLVVVLQMAGELLGLDERQIEAVRAWAETLARRFAHVPSLGLRAIAQRHGLSPVELFFAEGDEALARELREVLEEGRHVAGEGRGNGDAWQLPDDVAAEERP